MHLGGVLETARSFLRAEARNIRLFDVPWRRRLWLYANGFLSSKDAIWDLSDDTVDQYLSDLEYRNVKRINQPYTSGLKNELLFHLIVSPTHDHLLPDVYGLVRDGRFVEINRFGGSWSSERLVDSLDDETVVVKPVRAAKGDGVRILDQRAGEYRIDGEPVERTEVVEKLGQDRDLLVEEHVSQAEYAANIFPESTNTVRLLTMIDPDTGDPFVATATHRFGTTRNGHVDNWSAGGISTEVDLETGTLGPAVTNPMTRSGTVGRVGTHPDTGAQIDGVSIPEWKGSTDTVCDLAAEYGVMWPHVGWDVIVRDAQGSIAVLEGEPQSVDADQQAHRPLLADARIRRFYEHHGVLSEKREVLSI